MRLALSALVLLLGSVGACTVDQASSEDPVESTDEALAASGRKQTTRYRGTFSDSGETFDVELDIELPALAIGYQRSDSGKYKPANESPHCRVYDEWTPGTMTLRVKGSGGRVVAEKTTVSGTSGFANLERSECPDGFLLRPRVHPVLDAELSEQGASFDSGGHAIHVPRGYFSPGFVTVNGSASFRALSAGKIENKSDSAYNRSDYEVPRGVIAVSLPAQTTISVGVGPSMQRSLGYERIVDVTLRAR